MRYLSVCSGIEAATVAWHPLGWMPAAFSEIEAFPRAVLSHHYPDVPLHGDFTTIGADDYGAIDLLVGGTPCQSFSIAGLRGGLADGRGNLALEYLRLADRKRPRWLVWENVPGVLSIDGGRAFGSILGGMGELGYGFAYRVLDAQHFGVPQRRRRVFVVGYLGDWRRAAAVLFERHSLSGHPAPRREARERVARPIAAGSRRGSGYRNDADTADNLIAFGGNNTAGPIDVATARSSHGGPHGRLDFETETFVLMERGRNGETNLEWRADGTANAILTPNGGRGGMGVGAVAFQVSGNCGAWETGEITGALDTATDRTSHVVAFSENIRGELVESEISRALQTSGGKPGQGYSATRIGSTVRRLTPRECERLQGFPDDYTLISYRGKPAADGPRYKALGNSMAVPVMAWLGQRIAMVEALPLERSAAA